MKNSVPFVAEITSCHYAAEPGRFSRLGAALFGGARGIQAQPLNEPPPRPLALSETPPSRLKLTVPDDGLAASANPIQVVNYRPEVEPGAALLKLPAQVSVEVAGPASVTLGDPLHYELIVRNTGGSPACRVQVEAPFPSDAKLLQTDPVAEVRAGSLNWDLGTLEAGAERRLKSGFSGSEPRERPRRPASPTRPRSV